MSTSSVLKLNCEKCKLKTEHQRMLASPGEKPRYKCLRCGTIRDSAIDSEPKNYPPDDAKPAGVG